MSEKVLYTSTCYYVWQYNAEGDQDLWFIAHSKPELEEYREEIENCGADMRIEKRVKRTTDITEQFFKH